MRLIGICDAIVGRKKTLDKAFLDRFGVDLPRLLAFNFGHALTLSMPGLGTGNCNACLLHALLFFGLRSSTGEAMYHGLSTIYGHIAGISIGMSALFLLPENSNRLMAFAVLATFVSALMQNSGTNFFGLICIIFMSSVMLANWETPYADIQMDDIYSDFYGTCAAVAANALFHLVYPMPSARHNLFKGLAERIRAASARTTHYAEHLLELFQDVDRDYKGDLPQDDAILCSCIGQSFCPFNDIFQMQSELGVTDDEVEAARKVVQAVDALIIAVESMALPFCHKKSKLKPEPERKSSDVPELQMRRRRIGSFADLQTDEDRQARESLNTLHPIPYDKWLEWKQANKKGADGKELQTPRLKVLSLCHAALLGELADKLTTVCNQALDRSCKPFCASDLLTYAYDDLFTEGPDNHELEGESEGDEEKFLHPKRDRSAVLWGGNCKLKVELVTSFCASIEKDFFPLHAEAKFNSVFANNVDSSAALCAINGMQMLQETAMCLAPLRCWCTIAALLYTISAKFSSKHVALHYLARMWRILIAPIVAIGGVLLSNVTKAAKDPKKYFKKHFRRDMGDGLFLLKFAIGLFLLNLPIILVPGADDVFNNQHGSWVVFSFMFCLDKTRESSFRRSIYRLLSTAAAGILGVVAVFILDYSKIAFYIFSTVGIGSIAGSVPGHLRQYMSTFLSAFIVCITCPLVYAASPTYLALLLRTFSVIIGGSVAVIVSSYLWPISAYKRAKIEIATAVKKITECLLLTEPFFINSDSTAPSKASNAAPNLLSVGRNDDAAASISSVASATAQLAPEQIKSKTWLRKYLRMEIVIQETAESSSGSDDVSLPQKLHTVKNHTQQISDASQLLSESFLSLRSALQMVEMIEIAQNERAKAVMSRVEKSYSKIEQVREMLFTTLLLFMSVTTSVQACFRPPVQKNLFEKGFYGSLQVVEQNYISRSNCHSYTVGDFEKSVKGELRCLIVLLNAWESKVWPKHRRLRFLANTATWVANNRCLLIRKEVDRRLEILTTFESSSLPTTPRTFQDDLAGMGQRAARSVVFIVTLVVANQILPYACGRAFCASSTGQQRDLVLMSSHGSIWSCLGPGWVSS